MTAHMYVFCRHSYNHLTSLFLIYLASIFQCHLEIVSLTSLVILQQLLIISVMFSA